MEVIIGMPMEPYLKNYFCWKENLQLDAKVKVDYSTEFRMVLNGLLCGKFKVNSQDKLSDPLPKKFADQLICLVPIERIDRQLFWYTLAHIRFFNNYMRKSFHEDLLFYIMMNKQRGIEEKRTILSFMESLKIDHLVTFEALKKASYRARKNRKLPIFYISERLSGPDAYFTRVTA